MLQPNETPGVISFKELMQVIKCPAIRVINRENTSVLTYKEFLDLELHKLLKRIVSDKSFTGVESAIEQLNIAVSAPPLGTVLPSEQHRQKLKDNLRAYVLSFYKHIMNNTMFNRQEVQVDVSVIISVDGVGVDVPVDIVLRNNTISSNISYAIILDLSTSSTTDLQKITDPRSVLFYAGLDEFNPNNDVIELLWLSLSDDNMVRVNRLANNDSYLKDIGETIALIKAGFSGRRQGFWCSTCKWVTNGCHNPGDF